MFLRDGEDGLSRLPHKQKNAGSNPAPATNFCFASGVRVRLNVLVQCLSVHGVVCERTWLWVAVENRCPVGHKSQRGHGFKSHSEA